jgi:2,4-dienoyl-CoA reductase-like NADH-dependent reductase (Old Yellow Enzyme family)
MDKLFQPITFRHGRGMRNRLMLCPLTNLQSHDDGTLSDEELHWLTLRASGGFGLTMTCAAHVQAVGQGFPGQLGVFSDRHVPGLRRLADAIHEHGSLAIIQLHHAGMRAPGGLIGTDPVCPSSHTDTGARALEPAEIGRLTEDFVAAARRAETAGFDGVEIHGAHGYLIGQFLSSEINARSDRFGGSLENRSRLLFDIAGGIRDQCKPDFTLGLRLSPERFGMKLEEIRMLARRVFDGDLFDFLDLSLWDAFKEPEETAFQGRPLMSWFTDLDRGNVRLAVAGSIRTAQQARAVLEDGADIAAVGRAAILHQDFPRRVMHDPSFEPVETPVSRAYLAGQGLSPKFIDYMKRWEGFVSEE